MLFTERKTARFIWAFYASWERVVALEGNT
jgi:hypothetical protein